MSRQINVSDFRNAPIPLGSAAQPLSSNVQGMVMADGEESVVKYYYNHGPSSHTVNPTALQTVTREANALHLMSGRNDTGLQSPRLLEMMAFGFPHKVGDVSYAGALRMTRLPGQMLTGQMEMSPEATAQLLHDSGYTLGTLHNITRPIHPASLMPYERMQDRFFSLMARASSTYISTRETETLQRLHDENKPTEPPLLLHGDLGPGNMLFDENKRPIGVMDWGHVRIGRREDDFFHFSTNFQQMNCPVEARLGPTLEGYHAATGLHLDPAIIKISTMTNLALRLVEHERGIAPVNDFETFLLQPFKQMIHPHLPSTAPAATTAPQVNPQMKRAPELAPAPQPSRRVN